MAQRDFGPNYASASKVVDRHIRNLRAKLHDDFRHPRLSPPSLVRAIAS
jgi:DNA-binding response OmpR family regulator